MNVLVLGSGGREHALSWKIAQSDKLGKLYCLPGNPGTAEVADNIAGSATDFAKVKEVVIEKGINMVVVGPEEPLVRGICDYFAADKELKDVMFIGPDKLGATLEGSKDFAKEFMVKNGVPTARYESFGKGDEEKAREFMKSLTPPYVLKADGLAAGKGVLIIDDLDEAMAELAQMFSGKFGDAGNTVVIEQFLKGIEASCFVLTDGKDYLLLPEAKDYKRIGEGDKGLNTGGMGAVSPVPFYTEEFKSKVEERIVKPTIKGLADIGAKYCGFIFIGLMNCGGDPYVIEYNVRMGDPETEAVMTRIDSDFLGHLVAAAKGELASEKMVYSPKTALTCVQVSGGYPEGYAKGYEICGLDDVKEAIVFHAGTSVKDGKVVTSGGRVLAITALGETIPATREKLFTEVAKVTYTDKYFRSDIGLDVM
ncbi:MAG: phosphoribosylamine--glycine ligase [Bacteroidales bacterium]|nr:phosphoribosylamine--glycine ligase [Bacteroidales bacterium]